MEITPDLVVVPEDLACSVALILRGHSNSPRILWNQQILSSSLAKTTTVNAYILAAKQCSGTSNHTIQVRLQMLVGND